MPTDPTDLPPPELNLQATNEQDTVLVRCNGKLTARSSGILHSEVKRLIPRSKRIVLDLTDVSYMDSMGLGTIVGLYASAKAAGCNLELINFSKRVRELFGIANVLTLFEGAAEHSNRIP
jgi:anti-sigma B factor antagonist